MKIGYINYLNCYPFYHHMFTVEPVPGVEVVPGYPGELNRWMREGVLDLSPVSAGAYPSLQEDVLVLPDFCLSSIGYVRSVSLRSNVPIEELDGGLVGLTTASETSIALLKILLEKYYNLRPRYTSVSPDSGMDGLDAALIIGNDAMREPRVPVPYIYDLGDLWLRKTGHPVVFAIFVVRKAALDVSGDIFRHVTESFSSSLDLLRTREDEVVEAARKRYPGIHYDLHTYYELLKFEFTPRLKDALRFYYDEAASMGILPVVRRITFID